MDAFTIGTIIRALLQHAGVSVTLAVLFIGGFFFVAYKMAVGVGAFLSGLLEKRDQDRDQLARDLRAMDERRMAHEVRLAEVLATINTKLDVGHEAAQENSRKFDEMQKDITHIRGAVS